MTLINRHIKPLEPDSTQMQIVYSYLPPSATVNNLMRVDLALDHIQRQRLTIAAADGTLSSGSVSLKMGGWYPNRYWNGDMPVADKSRVLWVYSNYNGSLDQLEGSREALKSNLLTKSSL